MADRQLESYPYPQAYPPYEPPPPPFAPTAAQLERAGELRKFNLWTVYLPLGIVGVFVVGLVSYMLFLAIWPPYEGTRPFLSGLADSVLILFMLPFVLICGLLQAAVIGGLVAWRKSHQEAVAADPNRRFGRLRLFLWRVQQWLDLALEKIEPLLTAAADQVIKLNVLLTGLQRRWLRLRSQQD